MIDLAAIRERDRGDNMATWHWVGIAGEAIRDRRALLAEVDRLRAELASREFVVYRNCEKHLSIPWTATVSAGPVPRAVCPHCEPPKPAKKDLGTLLKEAGYGRTRPELPDDRGEPPQKVSQVDDP